jgi:NitT/TauT family transport system permease protein
MKLWLKRILFFATLLGAWAVIVKLKIWPEYLFPSPKSVSLEITEGIFKGGYFHDIWASTKRLLIGYGLSILIGIPLGCFLSAFKSLQDTVGSLILGLQTLPSICWFPLAILWFGLNDTSIIFVIVSGSALSVSLATTAGINQIPTIYMKVAQTTGAKGWALYRHVILPAALPTIVGGLKQGWSFAWRGLMSAELLFVGGGLGHLLNMGRELNSMEQVLAIIIVIIGIGALADFGFATCENKIAKRWGFVQRRALRS